MVPKNGQGCNIRTYLRAARCSSLTPLSIPCSLSHALHPGRRIPRAPGRNRQSHAAPRRNPRLTHRPECRKRLRGHGRKHCRRPTRRRMSIGRARSYGGHLLCIVTFPTNLLRAYEACAAPIRHSPHLLVRSSWTCQRPSGRSMTTPEKYGDTPPDTTSRLLVLSDPPAQ